MADDDDLPLSHPHHAKVRAVSSAVLLDNRWPKHQVEDGVDEVELRAWASKPRPATLGGWKALCRTIAKKMAIDKIRSDEAGGKESTRPTDRADEHEAANSGETMDAAIDYRRAIEEMRAEIGPEDRPVFDRWALGFKKNEIAKDLSMHPKEVSRRVSTMRTRFQARYAVVVAAALLAVGAYFVFRNKLGPDDQAHNQQPAPSSVPSAPPGPSPEQLAAQENRAKADDLRKLAVADCAAGQWKSCHHELQDAYALDPDGSDSRLVKRLTRESTSGIIQDRLETKTDQPKPRSFGIERTTVLVAQLAPLPGQSLQLVCATGAEPSHFCDQLAAALKKAGWTVTRVTLATDAGVTHGMAIDVATDASDATQNAADALAEGLGNANVLVRGPHDMPSGGDAALRLTVGVQ